MQDNKYQPHNGEELGKKITTPNREGWSKQTVKQNWC